MIDIQNTLTGVTFDMHGCIYFKDDLRSLGEEPKEANIQSATTSTLDIFAMGPLTTGELWNGVRSGMDLDRGPCKSRESTGWWKASGRLSNIGKHPSDYTRSLGRNEIAYMKSHAIPRMNYYRSLKSQEHPEDGLALLTKYMKVAPYLILQSTNETASNDAASKTF